MTEQPPMTGSRESAYDEISISELLMKLWAKRGLIVILPLVLAGLIVVWLLLGKTSQQALMPIVYYIELNGITISDNGNDSVLTTRYPNGAVFSPQDLKNPSVLKTLSEKYSIETVALASQISVDFGTPLTQGVIADYEAQKSAESDEPLDAIKERYASILSATAKRGLKIRINYDVLDLAKEQGQELAVDLASAWNEVFTTQFKTQIVLDTLSQREPIQQLDISSTAGFLAAENQLRTIERGAEGLAADSRLAAMTTAHGTTAADLIGYLEDFRSIYFDPLYLNAFATQSALSDLYQHDIKLQIDAIDEDINELNDRLAALRQFQRGVLSPSGPSNDTNTSSAQYDASALAEVVSLAERAASSAYLEETLNIRRELASERSALQTKLRRIENAAKPGKKAVTDDFLQESIARYRDVVLAYGALIESARSTLISQTPSYFSPLSQPFTEEPPLFARRDILFILLALALGEMLAVIVALVWPPKN
jgi:hypothetical protein